MQSRPFQSKKRYLLAFIIGTTIFLSGFLITYLISIAEYQRISNFQGETSYEIFTNKLSYSLFNKSICTNESLRKVSQNLRFQGVIINDLEEKLGKNNQQVSFRKKFYTLIELEHFEFVNQLNSECNSNITTLLFFYSNKEDDLGKSEDAGRILDTVYQKNPNLIIYSFDINLESELIKQLLKKYKIEKSPTAIINQNTKITNFRNINDVEKYLNKPENIIWLN